jgi:hypothetical protein
MTDATPIAWRAITYGTPVLAADASKIGTVREVLGSDADDIFHGIRVEIDKKTADDVVVTAAHVATITADAVTTDLSHDEASKLTRYSEEATYHLASVGWLRKHLGWVRDSESDEEPG